MKNEFFSPFSILFLALFLVLISCQEKTPLEDNQSYSLFAGEDGGEIIIDKFTRGDTPVWLGAMDDIRRLELLLKDLDSVSHTRIGYFGEPILDKTTEELLAFFELKPEASNNRYQFLESENLRLITRENRVMGMVFKQPEKVTIDGVFLSNLDILAFKKAYPKSYAMRNYHGDEYRINFSDSVPEVYDFAILKISKMDKKLQLRWVDGEIIDAKLVWYD
ncbi:hypothetical protein P872_15880 [Rhodonellum psychrophilum GCM71 = DSM 17998]|uniref:Uncharacterized protein n=2 Tax=Rhodonellum TaxID=336827 RepID=U5C5Q2_9BACT|nr:MULTISPECIES: hypothetical protein [Rhodonellum]ERM84261.1 hypothetical protein P872_15880 [Rhodonellum psychrophilum GCM71 = DSM 17998]SDZ18053.1 hypothetical protein SAMN05444412_10761 [Rhodonellum ikkaensis]